MRFGPGPGETLTTRQGCGRIGDVLAPVSFYYGHRDPVSVTAG